MCAYTQRSFALESDLPAVIELVRHNEVARRPRRCHWHSGDIIWLLYQHGEFDYARNVRLWFDGDDLAGIVVFAPPYDCQFDYREGLDPAGIAEEMLAWSEGESLSRAGAGRLNHVDAAEGTLPTDRSAITSAFDGDTERRQILEGRGYERLERHGIAMRLDLGEPPETPGIPPGYRLRYATDDDIEARVELHREAWAVWGPSRANVRDYTRLRAAPLYDKRLDVVLENDRGELVSYCICWADEETGSGYFEPVGTHREHARRGFGRAVTLEGLRRFRERGLHTALIGTASINVGAQALYHSCGFVDIDREHYYSKRLE